MHTHRCPVSPPPSNQSKRNMDDTQVMLTIGWRWFDKEVSHRVFWRVAPAVSLLCDTLGLFLISFHECREERWEDRVCEYLQVQTEAEACWLTGNIQGSKQSERLLQLLSSGFKSYASLGFSFSCLLGAFNPVSVPYASFFCLRLGHTLLVSVCVCVCVFQVYKHTWGSC